MNDVTWSENALAELRSEFGDIYRGRTVLVTGADGFMGSHLTDALVELGADVHAFVRATSSGALNNIGHLRNRLKVHFADLTDKTSIDYLMRELRGAPDKPYVFHLGAQTQVRHAQRHPFGTLEANVRGTYNLLEAVRRAARPVRAFVVASSDKAYGESPTLPYTEDHPLAGRNIYDASKSAGDLLASAYASSYGMPVGIARCGNIYGGGDLNWDRIVPGTIRSLLRGERPIIRSDGTLRRDYLYVDDAVAGYLSLGAALMDGREHGEAFNFGHGEPVAVLDLVEEIGRAVGRTDLAPVVRSDAPNEIPAQWLDATKARTRLGWAPAFTLHEGLSRTVEWYREVLA